jgi:lysophospholipase L1-like esterase
MKLLLLALLSAFGSLALQDAPAKPVNSATVPVPRTEPGILERQAECLRRAKETAQADVVFLGDSITQGWDNVGAPLWSARFAPLGALNLGVSGDRTENVLWRLEQAPLTRLAPKVIVLLIGTNNLGHGTHTAEQTLEGIQRVIAALRAQAPQARLLVHEIFPRGERFNPMRGDIAQINQALRSAQAAGGYRTLAIGDTWVRADGSIDAADMPDFLHLSLAGYTQWAAALEPALREALRPAGK